MKLNKKKLGAGCAVLAMSLAALPSFANHESVSNNATITYDGSEQTLHASLSTHQSHTLYETRDVQATCYREELAGYHPECTTVWEDQCNREWICGPFSKLDKGAADIFRALAQAGCDPNTQPSPHWGMKGGQCLASCGALGGTASFADSCGAHGMNDAGRAYDVPYCCSGTAPVTGGGGGGNGGNHDGDNNHGGHDGHGGGGNWGGGGNHGGGGGDNCRFENRCNRVPRQDCQQVPDYVSVPYACTKTETVAVGEELDFNVHADVSIQFENAPAGVTPSETLKAMIDGEQVSLAVASSSGKLLMFARSTQSVKVESPDNGPSSPGAKTVTASYNIALFDKGAVLASVNGGIGDVALKGQSLIFTVGRIAKPELLRITGRLDQDKFIDETLFDGTFPRGVMSYRDLGSRTEITVALDRMNIKKPIEKGKKYLLKGMSLSLDTSAVAGTLLNPEAISGSGSNIDQIKVNAQ